MSGKPIDQFIAEIPPIRELRDRLSQTVREGQLLRKLIRLAEQRDKAQERTATAGAAQ
jgi:hypothetical protein